MDEPLPTYMQAAKHKMRQAVQYPAAKMPSKNGRICAALFCAVVLVLVIAIPIAATRGIDFDNTDGTRN